VKTRIITAVIALAIFIPLIVYGGWPLTIAALALGIVAISEVLVMKKMFLISFEAIISYLGVALLILPDSWLDFLPSVATRWFGFYVLVVLLLLHTVIRKQRFTFDDAGGVDPGNVIRWDGLPLLVVARQLTSRPCYTEC
jgi:CDP-diglyceride synthetase